MNREILGITCAGDVLALVEMRQTELDAINLATALQRIAKIADLR